MEKFQNVTSIATPLDRPNVDTDQIVPKQFLKLIQRTGFGKFLFHDWRFEPDGSQKNDFVLNDPKYSSSHILIAGENFGCGSSREHAPIALSHCGIKGVLAVSFARIFYRNAVDGAFLLPIEIDEQTYKRISDGDQIEVDTDKNQIRNVTKNETYGMKPFSDIVSKIIAAGGLFKYVPE